MRTLKMFPALNPFDEDYLQVSNIHRIRYALYGNPKGNPVFFIHGGPGSGCDDNDARWFNPKKYFIITHDQRGCGKSTPLGELKENYTQALIDDIEKLRNHLNILKPISIFAGSWGSTLALLYAEKFPKNIKQMILRGIFTCTYEEQDYFYRADGAARFSPVKWNNLIRSLPKGKGTLQQRINHLFESSDKKGRKKWCRLLADYEYSFFNVSEEDFEEAMSNFDKVYIEMCLNIYYQANRFFLKDKEILRNIGRISGIPLTIIHGMNDLVCLPVNAWKLHKLVPHSEFHLIPEAGHMSSHPNMQLALLNALRNWK
ncbi:MAG: prolyl aminopeptidase [Ignavibacteria bacterium]